MNDWRGYVIAGFSLVAIANVYMSLFGLIRQDITKEKAEIKMMTRKTDMQIKSETKGADPKNENNVTNF